MRQSIFNFRHRKVGGIWFVRLGRLQFSFCLCRHVHDGGFTIMQAQRACRREAKRLAHSVQHVTVAARAE